jgi:hypothetical protein
LTTTNIRPKENALDFNQNILVLKGFLQHLAILSEPRLLELLSLANTMPITNEDARAVLKVGRRGAYYWLSELTRLTMLEKRGQAYRASPYSKDLLAAASITFGSLLMGKMPRTATAVAINRENVPAWSTVLQTAADGLELLYSRGRIDQSERARQQKMINDLRLGLDDAPRA